jgi:hypothetical protein
MNMSGVAMLRHIYTESSPIITEKKISTCESRDPHRTIKEKDFLSFLLMIPMVQEKRVQLK